MDTVRWGIVGCGQISDLKMAPAINNAKNCTLVSVCSRSLAKARKFAEKHRAKKYYDDMEMFLEDDEIDVIYVATPPFLHCDQTVKAAEYGKHVLCEKPMALALEECKEMVKSCTKENVKLMIACNMRFHPCHVKAKEIIEKGLLGKVILSRAQSSFYFPPDPQAWRLKPEMVGGGSLTDAGIHCVDLLRFLIDKNVVAVHAFLDNIIFDYPVEDTALLTMKFEDGSYGIVESCYSIRYTENILEIFGSERSLFAEKTLWGAPVPGSLRVSAGKTTRPHDLAFAPPWGQDSSLGGLGCVMKEYDLQPVNTYVAQVEHFASCVIQDKQPLIDGVEGLRDLQVVKAAYESSKRGKSIKLSTSLS